MIRELCRKLCVGCCVLEDVVHGSLACRHHDTLCDLEFSAPSGVMRHNCFIFV